MNGASQILLTIPPKADFISLVRLAVSGVASHCAFDIDEIEDIKVCVSEILTKIIAKNEPEGGFPLCVTFDPSGSALCICIGSEGLSGKELFSVDEDAFALAILDTLMDAVDLSGMGTEAVRLSKTMGRVQADD